IGPALALAFILVTAAILILDLERPERFFYILTRPNWRSWMVWGTCFLIAHGGLASLWLIFGVTGFNTLISWLAVPAILVAVLATSYTGFLFAQGLARDLWQGPHSAADLLAQASVEGASTLLILGMLTGSAEIIRALVWILGVSVAVHLMLLAFENLLSPSATRHHELATQAICRGAYARLFWGGAMGFGGLLPLLILGTGSATLLTAIAGALALAGAFAWEYVWVEAGQSVPLS
ncbi:MAG: NrfD/PsrC family molybdoenzyme membrane anchor subunit, partial [Acidimicrobiia bacterium]